MADIPNVISTDIPMDVIADLLSRLRVKTLLRFRCVSKSWCALIDGPRFIKLHLNRSIETKTNLNVIYAIETKPNLNAMYAVYKEFYSTELDSPDHAVELDNPMKSDYRTVIVGSCNGLLCLLSLGYTIDDNVALWNPSTRKHKKLPITPIELSCSNTYHIEYAFGYDHVHDDYKVMRIIVFRCEDNLLEYEVKVYRLKSNSWWRIHDFPYYLGYLRMNPIPACGALHWVTIPISELDTSKLIASFDLATEEFRLVPQPDYLEMTFEMNMGVLGECLCLVCNYFSVRVDIWVMKEYGVKESWTKLFSVKQPEFNYVRPLAYYYSKGRRRVLMEKDNTRLAWYDIEKKIVKNIEIHGVRSVTFANPYYESLVPPCGQKQPAKEKVKKKKKKKKKKKTKKRY